MSMTEQSPVADRAQARIRWPRPTPGGIGLILLWVVGLLLAIAVPALIVPPGAATAPKGDVILAAAITVAGALVMLVAAWVLYKKSGEVGYAVLGGVPATSCMVGGIVMMAAKLTGNVTGFH